MEYMEKTKKTLKFWVPPVLWAMVIFFFSSQPSVRTIDIYWQDFILKKTAHMIEYGVLATLLYRAFMGSDFTKKKALIFSLVLTIFYAATDEIHQAYIPGREARLRDVIFDTIGASLALYSIKVKVK
jgi:VanZ family protein